MVKNGTYTVYGPNDAILELKGEAGFKKNLYPYEVDYPTAVTEAASFSKNTNITSVLVNSAAWDRTLNWLVETKAITRSEAFVDSLSWGNYKNSSFNFIGRYRDARWWFMG